MPEKRNRLFAEYQDGLDSVPRKGHASKEKKGTWLCQRKMQLQARVNARLYTKAIDFTKVRRMDMTSRG